MKKFYLFVFFILPSLFFAQTDFSSTLTADLSAYGVTNFAGLGEYQIFLDTDDGILDKPIIMIDGFDPLDSRDIPTIYNLLSYTNTDGNQNLADFVRTQGFDVIILNFPRYFRLADETLLNIDDAEDVNMDMVIDELDYPGSTLVEGSTDFIERNAMLLIELLDITNDAKVGTEKNVILGPSMGGLISRYALNYMENQSMDADTRLWMSIDSPHHGANVPLGLQHQLNFLAFGIGNGFDIVELQPIINNFLKTPATRQLLTDHFEAHLANGSDVDFDNSKLLPEAHPWRGIFMSDLTSLTASGFPEDTRNVAIINGSGIGASYFAEGDSGTMVSPGFSVLDLDLVLDPGTLTDGEFEVNFTPESGIGPQLISRIRITSLGFVTIVNTSENAEAFSYSDGIDSAPGGLFDLSTITGDLPPDGITGDFLAGLNIDKFNFIPSVSGMALEITANGEIDWYHDFDLGAGTPPDGDVVNNTPFVNWYIPDDNQPHVSLNETNVTFALTEIIPETLSISPEELNSLSVERNPVSNALVIRSETLLNDALISIVDLTGKEVLSAAMDLSTRTSIPIAFQAGMYVLNISSPEMGTFKAKIIVK